MANMIKLDRLVTTGGNKTIRAILIGPPGCGKGTQAAAIIKEAGSCVMHIATGDLLREQIRNGTEAGMKAKAVMEAGGFVPDELVLGLIEDVLNHVGAKDGFVLDGFPRTLDQAEQLQAALTRRGVKLDAVVLLDVPDQILLKRICGRRVHLPSGRSYHVEFNPPKIPEIDDVTGEPLIARADDNADTLIKRLKNYHAWTEPVLIYFNSKSMLKRVDASGDPRIVTEAVLRALRQHTNSI